MINISKKFKSLSSVVGGYLALLPVQANAATVQGTIDNLTSYLSGSLAKAVGGLIIVVTGYMCFAGNDLPKKRFFQIAIGLGLILGGSNMYQILSA